MSAPAKTTLKWVLGLGLGVLFIWLGASDWPLHVLFEHGVRLRGTVLDAGSWRFDWLYFAAYLAVLAVIHVLRVIRWAPLLRPLTQDAIDFPRLNRVSAVGFMYLFVLPFRLGELARPYLLAERGDVTMSQVLATVVVERVVDGLVVSLALFLVLFSLPSTGNAATYFLEIQTGAWMALVIFAGALFVLGLAYWRRHLATRLIHGTFGRVSKGLADKLCGLVEQFFEGLGAFPKPGYLASFVGWTLVYWAVNGFGYWVLTKGFAHGSGAPFEVSLGAAYAMMCCVVVGMMLPNPPANVGIYWYFLLKPLALYGVVVGDPVATAFGLAAWLAQLVQQSAFGLWYVARGGRAGERYRVGPGTVGVPADVG